MRVLSPDLAAHRLDLATLTFWNLYGAGTARSLQIFLARSSLISTCRGTADVLPAARLTKIEWLAPSRSSSHPCRSRCRTSARRFTH